MSNKTLEELIAEERDRALASKSLPDIINHSTDLKALSMAGEGFADELDLETLVRKVTEAGVLLTGAAMGSFFYHSNDDDSESFKLYTMVGAGHDNIEQFGSASFAALLVPHSTPEGVVRIDDVYSDHRFRSLPESDHTIRSYMAVSVVTLAGAHKGVLLFTHPDANVFNERTERLARGVAVQAALAIGNAALYHAAKIEVQRRTELETSLELAQSAGRIGTFSVNMENRTVDVSAEFKRIYGIDLPSPLPFQTIIATVVSEHNHLLSSLPEECIERASLLAEYQIKRPSDGEIRWIARRAEQICNPDGKALRFVGTVQDITDQKKLQDELSEREAHYRHTIENSPLVKWSANPTGVVDFMSPLYQQWTGRDGIRDDWKEPVHPDDLSSMLENIETSLKNKTKLDDYHRLRFATGEYRWVRTRANPRLDENGNVIRWYGYVQDIHDEREATIKLEESESHYRSLIEFNPQVTWTAKPDGMLDTVAKRWVDWTGKPGTGDGWAAAIHPDDIERSFAAWNHSVTTGEPYDIEHRAYMLADSLYHWCHSRAYPRRDESGNIVKWYGSTEDIHSRKVAEQQVKESERRFRLIADSAPLPMWVTGLDRKRTFVNSAYMAFIGTDNYEIARDFDWLSAVHPNDKDELIAKSLAGEATLLPFMLEARYKRYDGEYRWLQSQSQPRYGLNGEHVGFHGVATDVTESKEAEQFLRKMNETLEEQVRARTIELEATHARLLAEINERQLAQEAFRQSQKMESVGQLTGGIAHDFNNMLQIISGNLELIKMQSSKIEDVSLSAKMDRYASGAAEGAAKAATLTAQLLAFSRKTRLQIDKVCANDVVPNVVGMMQRTVGKKINIKTDLADSLWLCLSDQAQLEVALVNLALNARDAMPDGGDIIIKTENRTIKNGILSPKTKQVVISVTDTGVGIPEENLVKIFEPFYTTKPIGKGTGLGLSMVYGFCQQANGKVEVKSEPGKGTTFELIFPFTATPEKSANDDKTAEKHVARGPATILVVDDEPGVREMAVNLLDSLGYNTLQAANADDALLILQTNVHIDMVFSDIVMPGSMDGFGLAAKMKSDHPDIPILLSTGYAEVVLKNQVPDDLKSVEILGKPYRLTELSQCVASVLEKAA